MKVMPKDGPFWQNPGISEESSAPWVSKRKLMTVTKRGVKGGEIRAKLTPCVR